MLQNQTHHINTFEELLLEFLQIVTLSEVARDSRKDDIVGLIPGGHLWALTQSVHRHSRFVARHLQIPEWSRHYTIGNPNPRCEVRGFPQIRPVGTAQTLASVRKHGN